MILRISISKAKLLKIFNGITARPFLHRDAAFPTSQTPVLPWGGAGEADHSSDAPFLTPFLPQAEQPLPDIGLPAKF